MHARSSPLSERPISQLESLIAASLRERREQLGLSQRDLAHALAEFNIPASRSIINKYERGPGTKGSKISFVAGRALGIILFQSETGLIDSVDIEDSDDSNPQNHPPDISKPPNPL